MKESLKLAGKSKNRKPAGQGKEPAGQGKEPAGQGKEPAGQGKEPAGQGKEVQLVSFQLAVQGRG